MNKLATSLELNHFYLHGTIDAKLESMIEEIVENNAPTATPYFIHQIDIKYVKLVRISNKATIITRVYQYYDEKDGYWKKKVLCDNSLMVKQNYFCYKLDDFYGGYNDLTKTSIALQVVYNSTTKKYQICQPKFIDKVPALIKDFYTIYTRRNNLNTKVNLLYKAPLPTDDPNLNPHVMKRSSFWDRLKAAIFTTRYTPDIMAFTYTGNILNRSLFSIIYNRKSIVSIVTDMSGSGNQTFLVLGRCVMGGGWVCTSRGVRSDAFFC